MWHTILVTSNIGKITTYVRFRKQSVSNNHTILVFLINKTLCACKLNINWKSNDAYILILILRSLIKGLACI